MANLSDLWKGGSGEPAQTDIPQAGLGIDLDTGRIYTKTSGDIIVGQALKGEVDGKLDKSEAESTYEGRAMSWANVGLDDGDFAGLSIEDALAHIASVMKVGQEVETYINGSIAPKN